VIFIFYIIRTYDKNNKWAPKKMMFNITDIVSKEYTHIIHIVNNVFNTLGHRVINMYN